MMKDSSCKEQGKFSQKKKKKKKKQKTKKNKKLYI